MKKGFTMIELIFVIVILGILASVAIPRLAGTRQDAEISATAANLRTLVSDAGAYYAVKNKFGTGDASIKWSELTNVPLNNPNGAASGSDGILKVGGKDCIAVRVQNRKGNVPAHILFLKKSGGAACTKVQNSEPIKAYFDSRVAGVDGLGDNKGAIPIGSSISIYETVASVAGSRPGGGATAPIGSKPAVATPATVAAAVASAAGSRPGAQATAPIGSKPATQKPATQKPAAQKPATQKPTAVASASQPEAPKPTGSKPGGYFSTATNGGQVTHGTGTGSTGHASPSASPSLFHKLFRW